jgi:DNA polymerase-3 subunit delta'
MIEEPPERTLFLLVSEEPDKIIPTILSRCQLVKIPSFRNDDITSYLTEKFGIMKGRAEDISRVAGGNIVRAAELCRNEDTSSQNLERFKSLMRFAWKKDVISLISWSEEVAAIGREAQKALLSFTLRLGRENLMLTLSQEKNQLVFLTGEEGEFSKKFHPFINHGNINALAEEINLAYSHIEANGNAKIIFLDLALKIARMINR